MKLVVTGPLGHIGSRLIRTIPADRFSEIVLVDDLSTQRFCSLFDLPGKIPIRFVEADICTADLARDVAGAEVVIHLAGLTDAMSSEAHRDRVMEVNVRGTERVARACAEAGAGFVFVSTTSVYGTQAGLVDEDCSQDELRPQSAYAESKLLAERALAEIGAGTGLRFVILRLGTIFGWSIGMRFHTAINRFVWQACTGRPVTVWTTAMNQLRPYLHLDDAV
ncbi:MAG: nucleoside-diphosphate sugar epimerase, partial [Gemmatimonadetes bacterium]|nr:nucleoside-diphosphate sugar epimerase [Gemmatimonadota bacterium]